MRPIHMYTNPAILHPRLQHRELPSLHQHQIYSRSSRGVDENKNIYSERGSIYDQTTCLRQRGIGGWVFKDCFSAVGRSSHFVPLGQQASMQWLTLTSILPIVSHWLGLFVISMPLLSIYCSPNKVTCRILLLFLRNAQCILYWIEMSSPFFSHGSFTQN